MTNHPRNNTAVAAATEPQDLADRVAALELYLQQLVFMLDAQGALDADALAAWLALAGARMQTTGSVPPAHCRALERLNDQVMQ
jgi:hypothetical protein